MMLALAALLILGTSVSASSPGESSSLALEARLDPEALISGAPFSLTATVHNKCEGRVPFFYPFRTNSPGFFQCVSMDSDGTTYAPWPTPISSTMQFGIQGTVLPLDPGQSQTFRIEFHWVCRVDPETGKLDYDSPIPLPPGGYGFSCAHEKDKATVPFLTEPDFSAGEAPTGSAEPTTPDEELEAELEALERIFDTVTQIQKPIDGLWTGRIAAPRMQVTVAPSPDPSIVIEGPRELVAGRSFPLKVTIRNPHPTPLELPHGLTVLTKNRGYGSWKAVLDLSEAESPILTIPPDSRWTKGIDLLRTRFEPIRIDPEVQDPFAQGYASTIQVVHRDGNGKSTLRSNTLSRELR